MKNGWLETQLDENGKNKTSEFRHYSLVSILRNTLTVNWLHYNFAVAFLEMEMKSELTNLCTATGTATIHSS